MKVCSKCKKEKELTEFYTHPCTFDGYRSECKACMKEYGQMHKARSYNPCVYEISNPMTNKRYIGCTRNIKRRISSHKYLLNLGVHKNVGLQQDWDTHGESSFTFKVIKNYSSLDHAKLHEHELIETHFEDLYNILIPNPLLNLNGIDRSIDNHQ